MSKTCSFVYLDKDGEISNVYLDALKKYGPEKAEAIYVKHMLTDGAAKLSKHTVNPITPIDDMLNMKKQMIAPPSESIDISSNVYKLRNGSGKMLRANSWLQALDDIVEDGSTLFGSGKNRFDPDAVAQTLGERNYITSISKGIGMSAADRQAAINNNPMDVQKHVNEVKNVWESKADWGTYIHEVLEDGIHKYNKLLDADPDANIDLHQIMFEVQKDRSKKKNWRKEITATNFTKVMTEVIALKDKIEKESGKKFKIYPEVSLYSKNMQPGKMTLPDGKPFNTQGLAGTADLAFIATDGSGEMHLGDFKTKDGQSAQTFDRSTKDFIGGPFDNVLNNPEGKAQAQMSTYAAMFREHGYKPQAAHVVLIEGIMSPDNGTDDQIGNREWKYRNFQSAETRTVSILDQQVKDFFELGEDNDIMEQRRSTGIDGTVAKWSTDPNGADTSQVHFIKDNMEKHVNDMLGNLRTDKNGEKFYSSITGQRVNVHNMTEAQIRAGLEQEYKDYKKTQAGLPQHIRSYFYQKSDNKKLGFLKGKQEAINQMLKGYSSDTHDMFIAEQEYAELNDIGPDVLVMRNKKTRAISLLSVNAAYNNKVNFETEDDGSGDKRTSIFGKYAVNKALSQNDLESARLGEARSHDFIKMKLAWAALRIQEASPSPVLIESLKVGAMLGKNLMEINHGNMDAELAKLQAMRKYAKDDFPDELSALLDDKRVTATNNYTGTAMQQLQARINAGQKIVTSYTGNALTDSLSENLEKRANGNLVDQTIIKDLTKLREEMYFVLHGKGYSDAAINENADYLLLTRALLEYLDFDLNAKDYMQNNLAKSFIRSASTSTDSYMQKMQVLYNESMSRIKKDFKNYSQEHDKALKALYKYKKTGGWTTNSTDEAFENLYRNYENKKDTEEQRANMMRLKDENDPSLHSTEKEYIRVFKKYSNAAMQKVSTAPSEIANGNFWDESYVPVMGKVPNLTNLENFKSTAKMGAVIREVYNRTAKSQERGDKDHDFKFSGAFGNQATDSNLQHSEERRERLGLTQDGAADAVKDVETNLAAILTSIVVAGSEKENMGVLTSVYSAVDTHLYDVNTKENSTDDLRDFMYKWKEMILFDRVQAEGTAGKMVDNINKIASKTLFSYSTKQAMTEMFTGMVQSTSSMMANQVRAFLFKDKEGARFTIKDWVWAGKAWLKSDPKMEQMVWDNGMLVADASQLKSAEYKGASKFSIFKSKAAFGMNQHFFNASITQTFIAEMRNKGILDAYIEETVDGEKVWVYDETKDKRFHIWDGKDKKTEPKTQDEWKKYKLWQAVREDLSKEGAIKEDSKVPGSKIEGRMTLPLTSKERTEIKHYATRLYGSFNKNAHVMGQYGATGRAMLRYKTWFAQKYANWHTKTHTSEFYGAMEWIEDADVEGGGYYAWKGKDFEGIIQSVGGIMQELYRTRSIMDTARGLSDIQKDNLSKLLSDMLLLLLTTTMVVPFLDHEDNKFMKTEVGKSLRKAIANGTADLNMIGTTGSMTESMLPGISMMAGAFSNAFYGTVALSTGDVDTAKTKFNSVTNISGVIKSTKDIMSIMQKDDK